MNLRQIRETYDRRAAAYDKSIGLGERWLLGGLRAAFGAELRGRTLEVAVGSGLNLPHYTDAVTHATAVDLSTGMLAEARNRVKALGRTIDLAQMDAGRLAFPDATFDTVAISLALCTVPDPAAVLTELARVCRPGGRLVLLEHVLSPVAPVALLERLLSPLQERLLGCHLDRRTFDTARALGFSEEPLGARFFDVFRLSVLRAPTASAVS